MSQAQLLEIEITY